MDLLVGLLIGLGVSFLGAAGLLRLFARGPQPEPARERPAPSRDELEDLTLDDIPPPPPKSDPELLDDLRRLHDRARRKRDR